MWDAISLVDDGCAGDARDDYADDEDAIDSSEASAQPFGAGDDAGRQDRVRDVDESGLQVREAECLDYIVAKALCASVRHLCEWLHGEDQPSLRIAQAFFDLLDVPARVLRAARTSNNNTIRSDLSLFGV